MENLAHQELRETCQDRGIAYYGMLWEPLSILISSRVCFAERSDEHMRKQIQLWLQMTEKSSQIVLPLLLYAHGLRPRQLVLSDDAGR